MAPSTTSTAPTLIERSMYLTLGSSSGADQMGTLTAMTKASAHLAGSTVETVPPP